MKKERRRYKLRWLSKKNSAHTRHQKPTKRRFSFGCNFLYSSSLVIFCTIIFLFFFCSNFFQTSISFFSTFRDNPCFTAIKHVTEYTPIQYAELGFKTDCFALPDLVHCLSACTCLIQLACKQIYYN